MKHIRLLILPFLLLLSSVSHAALITEIGGITIGSNPGTYKATFHDFDIAHSYNSLFSTGGPLVGLSNDATSATFAEWMVVANDLMLALGALDHVDVTNPPSDGFVMFVIPSDLIKTPSHHSLFYDAVTSLNHESIGSLENFEDDGYWQEDWAIVTFAQESPTGTAPTPMTMFLLVTGLLAFSAARSRKRSR